ncbi:hypothetical protein Tco_0843902 [Tanacetum coccineum]
MFPTHIFLIRGVVPTKTTAYAKNSHPEYGRILLNAYGSPQGRSRGKSIETSDGIAAIQAQLDNLGREIKKEEEKTLEEAYYTQFDGPFQGGDIEQQLQAKRHEENSNLIKEIRATTDAAIRNQGTSIKTLEIQIRKMSKVLQERGFGSLPSSTEMNPRDQVKSISTTIEVDSYSIRRIGSS